MAGTKLVCGVDTGLEELTMVLLECQRGRTPKHRKSLQVVQRCPLKTEDQCVSACDRMLDLAAGMYQLLWYDYGRCVRYAVEMYGWQGPGRSLGTVHVGPQIARMGGALEQMMHGQAQSERTVAISRNKAMRILGHKTTKSLNSFLKRAIPGLESEHHYAAAAVAWAAFLGM